MKKTQLAMGRGARVLSTPFRCLLLLPMLLLGCFGLQAGTQTQQTDPRVSVDVKNVPISGVFQSIRQQTGYSFVYNTADIDTERRVTLAAKDETLGKLLDALFSGSGVAYTLRNKYIVLSKKAGFPPPVPLRAV